MRTLFTLIALFLMLGTSAHSELLGITEEERQYSAQGVLTTRTGLIDSKYGHARISEVYSDNGRLLKRTIHNKERPWLVREEYNQEGEIIAREERLDHNKHGLNIVTHWDGTIEKTNYFEGTHHGDYELLDAIGTPLEIGRMDMGMRVGPWIMTSHNEITYANWGDDSKLQSEHRVTTLDGALIRLSHYRNGVLHGPFEKWDRHDHFLVKRGQYHQGKRQGTWLLWQYGELHMGEIIGETRHGEWRSYEIDNRAPSDRNPDPSRDGQLLAITNYNDKGEKHGREYNFDSLGNLHFVRDYYNGEATEEVSKYKHGVFQEKIRSSP